MSAQRNAILERIRKLFAMEQSAGSIGNEHEAAAFAAKVSELMNQHNVDKSELTPEEIKSQNVNQVQVSAFDMGMKYSRKRSSWMEGLARTLCHLHQCRFAIITGANTIYFYGTDDNLEVVVALYTFFAPLLDKMSVKSYDRFYAQMEREGTTWEARGFRASWLIGAVQGIGDKIEEKQAFAKTSSGKSLIRLTDQLVHDYMANRFHSSAERLSNKNQNAAGYCTGKLEGKALNVDPLL